MIFLMEKTFPCKMLLSIFGSYEQSGWSTYQTFKRTPLLMKHFCETLYYLNFLFPGANVEGNVDVDDDVSTETPLQLASAGGKLDIVELLLSFGASPFISTLKVDTMSFGSSAQKGCYCALSTAASHGQRKVLHKLVTHPTTLTSQNSGKEVLSLEEILAEGVAGVNNNNNKEDKQEMRRGNKPGGNLYSRFSKTNVKKLQVKRFSYIFEFIILWCI